MNDYLAEEGTFERAAFLVKRAHQAITHATERLGDIHQRVVRTMRQDSDEVGYSISRAVLSEGDRSEAHANDARQRLWHMSSACRDTQLVAREVVDYLNEAAHHLEQANKLVPLHPDLQHWLGPKVEALGALIAVAKPMAEAAVEHLGKAAETAEKGGGRDLTAGHVTFVEDMSRSRQGVEDVEHVLTHAYGMLRDTAVAAMDLVTQQSTGDRLALIPAPATATSGGIGR
jgi:hypothetical protein